MSATSSCPVTRFPGCRDRRESTGARRPDAGASSRTRFAAARRRGGSRRRRNHSLRCARGVRGRPLHGGFRATASSPYLRDLHRSRVSDHRVSLPGDQLVAPRPFGGQRARGFALSCRTTGGHSGGSAPQRGRSSAHSSAVCHCCGRCSARATRRCMTSCFTPPWSTTGPTRFARRSLHGRHHSCTSLRRTRPRLTGRALVAISSTYPDLRSFRKRGSSYSQRAHRCPYHAIM